MAASASSPLAGSQPRGRDRLAFALDYPTLDDAARAIDLLAGDVGVFKVGLELFVQAGPAAVRQAAASGRPVFLDLKLHDIQATVERAVATAADLGVRYLTVHASGGPGMLEAAAQRAERSGTGLLVLAVSVLTNLSAADLAAIGVPSSPTEQVLRLARLAQSSGVPGLVCSSEEVGPLRAELGPEFVLVTPGIRPTGADAGDQKRVGTPAAAIRAGSSLLVVGRPIRDAADPRAAAQAIAREIESVG